ncbi:ATP-binding protein [Duganella sp. BuS-21]|uniref:ATP-binding protein n=1 Tax=Duganella sp. BuS-21 TaxID=2943848 RepID=UPI0035A64A4B
MKLTTQAEVDLSEFFDGHPVATFAINREHVITHWNRACEQLLGWTRACMVGTRNQWQPFYTKERPLLSDLLVSGEDNIGAHYPGQTRRSTLIPGAYESEDFFPNIGASGHWLHFTAAPLRDAEGNLVGAIETLRDVTERRVAENALRKSRDSLEHIVEKRTAQLAQANDKLEDDIRQLTELNDMLTTAQQQLVQSEKMASIGQLAAGVAHEINNPIGYIFSNVGTLQNYLEQLFGMLDAYQQAEASIAQPAVTVQLRAMREQIDLDFLRQDIPALMRESREGIVRVRHIVEDLKDFSRADAGQQWTRANLHQGIDSTLNIVANEVKYRADVVKAYGEIPEIECLPLQINQVVLNLVINAAQAMGTERGLITLRTGMADPHTVKLEVEDSGPGIPPEALSRIFDPFFTTKAVGKGTGLGLSLAYGIVKKHGGRIEVDTEPGRGSCFRVLLPIRHTEVAA